MVHSRGAGSAHWGAYRFGPEGSTDFAGQVQQCEPPRYIRFGNAIEDEGYFQYELTATDGGTRLRFVQHFAPGGTYTETPGDLGGDLPAGPGTPWKPGFVGGWHEFWDALADFLDGVPAGSRLPPTEFGALSASWTQKLARSGAFTPGQAARAALGLRREERWNELNKLYRAHIRATVPAAGGAAAGAPPAGAAPAGRASSSASGEH